MFPSKKLKNQLGRGGGGGGKNHLFPLIFSSPGTLPFCGPFPQNGGILLELLTNSWCFHYPKYFSLSLDLGKWQRIAKTNEIHPHTQTIRDKLHWLPKADLCCQRSLPPLCWSLLGLAQQPISSPAALRGCYRGNWSTKQSTFPVLEGEGSPSQARGGTNMEAFAAPHLPMQTAQKNCDWVVFSTQLGSAASCTHAGQASAVFDPRLQG